MSDFVDCSPHQEALRLVGLLQALAFDCEETDGWQDAAEDLRSAANWLVLLERLACSRDSGSHPEGENTEGG